MFSVERIYETDIITLFHASGDFRYRNRWMEGIKSVETFNHFLPRVGMKCRCVTDHGVVNIVSSYYYYQDDKIQFTETDEDKGYCTHFTLEKTGIKKTKLTLIFTSKKFSLQKLFFALPKKESWKILLKNRLRTLKAWLRNSKFPAPSIHKIFKKAIREKITSSFVSMGKNLRFGHIALHRDIPAAHSVVRFPRD